MATGFVSSVENCRTGVKSNVDGSRSSEAVSSRVSCHSGGDSFVRLSTPVLQATASVWFNSQTRIQGSNESY